MASASISSSVQAASARPSTGRPQEEALSTIQAYLEGRPLPPTPLALELGKEVAHLRVCGRAVDLRLLYVMVSLGCETCQGFCPRRVTQPCCKPPPVYVMVGLVCVTCQGFIHERVLQPCCDLCLLHVMVGLGLGTWRGVYPCEGVRPRCDLCLLL